MHTSDPNRPNPDTPEAALARVVHFFEQLQPSDVTQMAQIYSDDAQFKDPFNEVTGVAAIQAIFEHMFEALHAPRFVITQCVQQSAQCCLMWDFSFAFRTFKPHITHTIRGASHLVLRQDQGVWRVAVHRDYWDAAEELYEKLPLVGAVMRWLKRRANR